MKNTLNDISLFKKYDIYAEDYTDYPHKSNWSENFGDKEYRYALNEVFSDKNHAPTLFYVHIPFCNKLCFYCICHKDITSDYDKISDHFENYLSKEIKMLHEYFGENSLKPNFKEIYLGGGSPTLLQKKNLTKWLS